MPAFNPSYIGPRPDVAKLVPTRCTTVLDVGCATGALGAHLKETRPSLHVTGIEIDPEMAAVARDRIDHVVEGDVMDVVRGNVLADQRFDCVVLADVLEHLSDPWTAIKLMRDRVEPGGVVVASLPNVRHYSTLLSVFLFKRWPYRDRGIHDRTHLRFFAERNVRELFEGADLEITTFRRQYRVLEPPYRINRFSLLLAVPPLRDLLTFQYLIVASRHRAITPG